MPFLQLSLEIGAADPQAYEDLLLDVGALSITLQDAGDTPVLEPPPGATPLWPKVRISALFEASANMQAVRDRLSATFAGEALELRTEVLEDRPWEREWLKYFKPLRFGQRLWVCPDGQRPACSDSQVPPVYLDLDPGLAFGTGTHPTTALCLEWLDGADLRAKHVIDYGCGSGILAIAALKLGAASAVAIDIDPQALIATRDNAQRNGVAERLTVAAAPPPSAVGDVLVANILAEPLEKLAAQFSALVPPGGQLVLSGLLSQQAATVAMRYRPWFDIRPVTLRDDWARLDGVRTAS